MCLLFLKFVLRDDTYIRNQKSVCLDYYIQHRKNVKIKFLDFFCYNFVSE